MARSTRRKLPRVARTAQTIPMRRTKAAAAKRPAKKRMTVRTVSAKRPASVRKQNLMSRVADGAVTAATTIKKAVASAAEVVAGKVHVEVPHRRKR